MAGRPRSRVIPEHCRECSLHMHKDRSPTALHGGSRTGILSKELPESLKECTWFQTADGRAASSNERMEVIKASVNGATSCPVRRAA